MKLWEVKHDYYCSETNFYKAGGPVQHKTWHDFLESMGNCDMDYNLLFRWDWIPPYKDGDSDNPIQWRGDENYRDCKLQLFWMQQRKGLFVCHEVEVCRADEPAVREWLQPRLNYLMRLWEPLVPATKKGGRELHRQLQELRAYKAQELR